MDSSIYELSCSGVMSRLTGRIVSGIVNAATDEVMSRVLAGVASRVVGEAMSRVTSMSLIVYLKMLDHARHRREAAREN